VPRLWWDGAHNLDGMRRMCSAWTDDLGLPPPAAIVFAAGRDKDVRAMLVRLRSLAPAAALFVTRTANERARAAEELQTLAQDAGWRAEPSPSVAEAIEAALGRAAGGRVLLCGSLFAVGEAMQAKGGAPGERV
jgi:folylpolyglutamate synthase/dihydropteroate synthase